MTAAPEPATPEAATFEPVVEVVDLHVHFAARRWRDRRSPVRAVDGVSLTINRGEIVALVGESGCGKSTIAQAIMRLVPPTSGQVLSHGVDVTGLKGKALREARQRFQMIFQDPFGSLDPRQTVFEAVVEPLLIHGLGENDAERRERVLRALDFAHLRPPERLADRYPHELSGGQRQRVAIAAAVVLDPELVVADEPVSMLDVSARAGILSLMADLRDELAISYLFITHDLSTAWVLADRIAVVYLGRIVELGPAATLVSHPRHPYTQALLAVATDAEAVVLEGETPSADAVPAGCRFHPRCPRFRALGEPEACLTQDPVLVLDAGPDLHSVACHFAERPTPVTPPEEQS